MDRPALNGFEIIEQLEKEFGLASHPVTWPVGSGDRFCGLYHRPTRQVRGQGGGVVFLEGGGGRLFHAS
jgi:peptide chain release factor 3